MHPHPTTKLRILLILARDRTYCYGGFFRRSLSYAPLTLSTLAALVPKSFASDLRIVDEGVQPAEYGDESYDIVGISCVASSAPRAYALCAHFRKRGSLVVVGGAHPTLNSVEAQQHADAVVAGPAELSWPQLIRDFVADEVKPLYRDTVRPTVSVPTPLRSLLPRGTYLRVPTVVASRGCPNGCSFCSVTAVWGNKTCARPLDEVIAEIRELRSRRILFLDPNLIADRDYAKRLFAALIPLGIRWGGLATMDITQDVELFDLAVKSGCDGLLMGFESVSPENLSFCGKHFNDVSEARHTVALCHRHGIGVLGCFVLGFDGDTEETFDETVKFIDAIDVDLPRFSVLTPFPGTKLFERYRADGRILTDDLNVYDTEHVVFRPRNMTPETLQRGLYYTWKTAYSIRRVMHRVRTVQRNRMLCMASNLGFRHYAYSVARRGEAKVAP
jgi:radical SAM superfamily enzyme YgiQ (UPF0313 family)